MMTNSDIEWDHYFLGMAGYVRSKSKDQSTKVGAVIVADSRAVLSTGWNGFPRGVTDDIVERHERPAKYHWTEHAERNAIYNAARHGIRLEGSTLYSTHMPCCDCARGIIQSGVVRVVTTTPDLSCDHVAATQQLEVSIRLFQESCVEVHYYSSNVIDGPSTSG